MSFLTELFVKSLCIITLPLYACIPVFLGIESASWPQLAKVTSQVSRLGVRWTACCERSSQLLIFPQSCDDGSLLCTSDDRYTNPNGKLAVALFPVVKGRKLVVHDYERSFGS